MFRFGVVLMIYVLPPAFPQDARTADSEREKDVYAIYSLMLTNSRTTAQNDRYLIASATVPGYPEVPCVQPPLKRNGDFRQVLGDFERRKAKQRILKPMFLVLKPYVLLTAEEVNAIIEQQPSLYRFGQVSADERFRGVTDLFLLSDVYFNPRRTLALTAIFSWCGGLCGTKRWKVFEKLDNGKWEERRWVMCSTISKNVGLTITGDLSRVYLSNRLVSADVLNPRLTASPKQVRCGERPAESPKSRRAAPAPPPRQVLEACPALG